MHIIPLNMRNQFRCSFCGETRSVKYIMDIDNPEFRDITIGVPCCNKCALMHYDKSKDADRYAIRRLQKTVSVDISKAQLRLLNNALDYLCLYGSDDMTEDEYNEFEKLREYIDERSM